MKTKNENLNPNYKSKFEKKAISLIADETNKEKIVKRAYLTAKGKIDIQIAQLKAKIVEIKQDITDAEENVELEKYSVEFNLKTYDNVVKILQSKFDELETLENTLKARTELLQSWS